MSGKNARTVSVSSFEAGHQMEQNLAAIFANAPGGDHRFTRLAGAQPLGNSIDIEVDTNYTLTPAFASSKSATSVVRRVLR